MNKQFAIGIDFGATQIKMGKVDSHGRVLAKKVLLTEGIESPEDFLELVRIQVQALKNRHCIGLGIGLPGLVDTHRGLVHQLVNIPGWKNVPVSKILEHRLHLPVRIDNDVNLMALGEFVFGAGRGCRNVVSLTLGTGVGGGIIIEGELYRGANLSAGEIGHWAIHPKGRRCRCGGRGCLEAYVGNRRIVELARTRIRRHPAGLLARWVRAGEVLSPVLISRAAHRKDRLAIAIWKEIGTELGIALASVVNLLNPERIIIGGGVSNAGAVLFKAIRETVRDRAMSIPAKGVSIHKAKLGENAGMIGAAVLAGITKRRRAR